jgi:hypothetical protein
MLLRLPEPDGHVTCFPHPGGPKNIEPDAYFAVQPAAIDLARA